MKTISELMAGKVLGSVRLKRESWDLRFFIPHFEAKEQWHGKDCDGDPVHYDAGVPVWEICAEKPRTVIVYEWMYFNVGMWLICNVLETEQGAAIRWADTNYKKTGREFVVEVEN